jgi:hypothetical protein
MITRFEGKCIVCGELIYWTNPKEKPKVCFKRMCQTNYKYQQAHMTREGFVRDLKDIGIWKGSKNSKG